MPLFLPLALLLAAPDTGTITGRVVWRGPLPMVPALEAALPDGLGVNPYAPAIDPTHRGVAGAVVLLCGIDPATAKPWDLPPVRIEANRQAVRVLSGDEPKRVGFVRRGDEVPMQWADASYRNLRARGAAFWSLAFPDAATVRTRRFDRPGHVRLSGGSGEFWLAADLWVCDHPYFTTTAADGSFRFDGVPAGPCEVVAWLPNWEVAGRDRDPEAGIICRIHWAPARERAVRAAAPASGVEVSVE